MTFKELYLSGQIPFEEIDRYIPVGTGRMMSGHWQNISVSTPMRRMSGSMTATRRWKEMLDARERVAGTPVTLGKTDISSIKMDLARCQSSVFLLMMRRYCFARRMMRVSVSLIRRAFIRTVRRRSAMR